MSYPEKLAELLFGQETQTKKSREEWIVEMVAFAADLADLGYEEEEIIKILEFDEEE